MRTLLLHAADEDATLEIARRLGPLLPAGMRIGLSGTLGAGKTTFARAVARSLGVGEAVTSPTFVLLREYVLPEGEPVGAVEAVRWSRPLVDSPRRLLHLDLYRLSPAEIPELMADVSDALDAGAVALIEWPERAGDEMVVDDLRVRLLHAPPEGPEPLKVRSESMSPPNAAAAGTPPEHIAAEPRWIELVARHHAAAGVLLELAERVA